MEIEKLEIPLVASPTLHPKPDAVVRWWLLVGVVMIAVQVFIGGVTRLTGSGLSITKWEIVTGTLPPLNVEKWNAEFDLYKATPQYQKINKGMSMSDFKFIYFWEYFHRLWARSLGFVFLLPFLFFWLRKQIPVWLMRRLVVAVLMGALVATFGWIMVASGFINRPWVNAYKLTLHLSLALMLFSWLFWTYLKSLPAVAATVMNKFSTYRFAIFLLVLCCFQIMLGGIMSGMKAGLLYPTWPVLDGGFLPAVLLDPAQWNSQNFVEYDKHTFMAALIQFLHRGTAYLLTISILWYLWVAKSLNQSLFFSRLHWVLIIVLATQFLLGVYTLIQCKGTIPVGLGSAHQTGAVALLSTLWLLVFRHKFSTKKVNV